MKYPKMTKRVKKIIDKLDNGDVEILTEYITKMLLVEMLRKYQEAQKDNNPLSI